MKYPQITKAAISKNSGSFAIENFVLHLDIPKDYKTLVKKIDESFKKGIESSAQKILENFGLGAQLSLFHWDARGLYEFFIGAGNGGALFDQETGHWSFKSVKYYRDALAVSNILTLYLNNLQQYRELK